MRALLLALCLALAACGDDSGSIPKQPRATSAWEVGPIIDGKNYSPGTTLAGDTIAIPRRDGTHYISRASGPLTGKSRIVMRYRVELAEGAAIVPVGYPEYPSIITIFFQRADDDWQSATGRWFAGFASHLPIVAGEHEMIAPLDGNWGAVATYDARSNPTKFEEAKATASRIGFVLGGGAEGLGHGVYATGPAKITVIEFRVE